MLAIILAEDESFFRSVAHRFRLGKYSVVRYRDPVKLADNLQELKPAIVVIRAVDYPLHIELLAAELFYSNTTKATKIIVFSDQAEISSSINKFINIVYAEEKDIRSDPDLMATLPHEATALDSVANQGIPLQAGNIVEPKSRLVAAAERRSRKPGLG